MVAVGAMVATLPVAVAPVSAAQVTVAAWPALSLVASASAKLADTCICVRSASCDEARRADELLLDVARCRRPPDDRSPTPRSAPTLPLTAVTVPAIGAVRTVPATARCGRVDGRPGRW